MTLPTIAAGGTNLALTLTVTVTDSATPANTATATLALTVNAPPAPQVSTGALSCVQCGDLEFEEPCTATQLIFDEVTLCPGNEVACMTDAKDHSNGDTTIYKRCVDQPGLTPCGIWKARTRTSAGILIPVPLMLVATSATSVLVVMSVVRTIRKIPALTFTMC